MKKFIISVIISFFLFGCASIPTGPENFDPSKMGAVHLDAVSLSDDKASYLYVGVGKEHFLMLTEFNAENYQDAFGVKAGMGNGLYDQYLKIPPGVQDLTITSLHQGGYTGTPPNDAVIHLTYEFVPGYVYVFDQTEEEKISVLFWKLGSEESYKDEIALTKERD